ncbi:hypothetical protein ACP275_07G013800 [Erythranthe tilingii]
MAALHYAIATSLHHRCRRFTSETLNHRRPVLSVSSFSAALPAPKPTRRKNHLRHKILKTLKNPIIPNLPLPPANPVAPINSPPLHEIEEPGSVHALEESGKYENSEAEKIEELTEVEVSSAAAAAASFDGNVGVLAKDQILKYGLWLVGAFVFQTVCAIWVFGAGGIDSKNETRNGTRKSSLLEEGGNEGEGKPRVRLFLNGNVNEKTGFKISDVDSIGYLDELEIERKIEEIRIMAREAREKERLASKNKNGFDSEESEEIDEGKFAKSGIELEVDNRLVKLRKKLGNSHDKMPKSSVGYSKKENTTLDERENNGALLFKKKYKFKVSSGDPVEKPKGFTGSDDARVKSGNSEELIISMDGDNGAVGLGGEEKQREISDVDSKGSDAVDIVEEDKTKLISEMNGSTKKTRKKVAKETGISKHGKAKGFGETKGIVPEKKNGRKLNAEAVKTRKSAIKSESGTELWWSNLPYVLAIIMQRGYEGEGGEGFYTLKSISETEDRTSHIVAFEDRSDANNFCYLLQSFFEDLQDFVADVVPLTVKELHEAVKSRAASVLVVKKGQLRLYAGQPLADAEVALRDMITKG